MAPSNKHVKLGAKLQEGIQGEALIMRNCKSAQDMRKYKTVANEQRYRRPDGTLISTPILEPDDPGFGEGREDVLLYKSAINGSRALLRALQAVHG